MNSDDRARLAGYWAKRARAEREVGAAFIHLETALAGKAETIVLEQLRAGAEDEARHAILCEELASHHAGHRVEAPRVRPLDLPRHEGVSMEMVPVLHLVAQCAIQETIATVWLRSCLALSRSDVARRANHVHLREEMNHARIGWAHLGSAAATPEVKAVIGAWLQPMLQASLRSWWDADEDAGDAGFPDEGVPSLATTRAAVEEAVREVILPGFDLAGVSTEGARRWFEAHAPIR